MHNQGHGVFWSLLFLPRRYLDNVFVSKDSQSMELRVTKKIMSSTLTLGNTSHEIL